jgi:hypothetical protein
VPDTREAPVTEPVVVRFSSPKEMAPLESVMEAEPTVRVPKTPVPAEEKLAAVMDPVVVRFSSPKEIAPDESVIEPLVAVKVPEVKSSVHTFKNL